MTSEDSCFANLSALFLLTWPTMGRYNCVGFVGQTSTDLTSRSRKRNKVKLDRKIDGRSDQTCNHFKAQVMEVTKGYLGFLEWSTSVITMKSSVHQLPCLPRHLNTRYGHYHNILPIFSFLRNGSRSLTKQDPIGVPHAFRM